jgi:XTP/dITP diphosphohydrolase
VSLRKLLIATTNHSKLTEITPILEGIPFEILTLAAFSGRTGPPGTHIPPPEETGRTFAENARAKAFYYTGVTGELTVAEDSGFVIDALDGAPGVESARYGGPNTSYPEKFALIYDALRSKNTVGSSARFVCAIALAKEGRALFEAEGVIEGRIAAAPKGAGGFGYDPIFYYPPFAGTLAEAGSRKAAVSHRGQAFRALRSFLTSAF